MDFICALGHVKMHLESVRVGVKFSSTTSSNKYYTLYAYEIRHERKLSAKLPG